jgi:S-DNA-T family DNA segregation ATPase FtsK/SpoIIIE
LVGLVVLYRWAGWVGLVTLAGLALVTGTGWRRRWPVSFERLVTTRLRSWWRWRRVYRPRRAELMDGCGLVESTDRGQTMPQIGKLTSARDHDDLTVHLPAGQVPDDIVNAADAIAHGLQAWRVTATNLGRGRVGLVVYWVDPLADPLAPDLPEDFDPESDGPGTPGPGRWLTPQTILRRLAAVVVGRVESGGEWTLALLPGRQLLVSGSTGSGKQGPW